MTRARWVTVPLRVLVPVEMSRDEIAEALIDRWDAAQAIAKGPFLDSLTPEASAITFERETVVK